MCWTCIDTCKHMEDTWQCNEMCSALKNTHNWNFHATLSYLLLRKYANFLSPTIFSGTLYIISSCKFSTWLRLWLWIKLENIGLSVGQLICTDGGGYHSSYWGWLRVIKGEKRHVVCGCLLDMTRVLDHTCGRWWIWATWYSLGGSNIQC